MTQGSLFFLTLQPLDYTGGHDDILRTLVVCRIDGPSSEEIITKFAERYGIEIIGWSDCTNQSPDVVARCRFKGRQYKLAFWCICQIEPILN
jgi:hypothetical protein